MLRASYPISTNPADTVIGGYSDGALAAAEIALSHSDVFGNGRCHSRVSRGRDPGDEEPNATVRNVPCRAAPANPLPSRDRT